MEEKNKFTVLDSGVHHFPVITCESCGGLQGSHIILTYRFLKHGILDIEYLCLCGDCYNDYCMMKDYKKGF